ncbi:MAG TPA: ABC transporter ATP-binding protein [Glycomyces sp.]|nr:ABC transporter ATP-binding protein [Glycomyces sp.]
MSGAPGPAENLADGAASAGLDAHLVVVRDTNRRDSGGHGEFRLDLRLRVAPGETVALLGPNGAGKTTALRALAGLEPISEGHVILNGAPLDRPGRRGWVPPEQRRIGVVFQDYLLFPHLNAVDNVAFGPRRRGRGRAEARALAAGWLGRVGMEGFGKRRPGQLSGGQAQRVALARALATEPALLLLDEPLSALDARTRLDTRVELHRHLAGHEGAAVLVTHDPVDALMLADRLVVVEDGRAVQEGDAESVTARPRTDYIARLVGLNLYRGKAEGHQVHLSSRPEGSGRADPRETDLGEHAVGEPLTLTAADSLDGQAFAAFAPSSVALYLSRPEGSPRNTWLAMVSGVHRHGDNLRVQLAGPIAAAADVTPAAAAQLGLEPGQEVWATVKATEIRVYPA